MDAERRGHETRDVDVRLIVLAGVALLVVAVLIHLALALQFRTLQTARARENPPPPPLAAATPPAPPEPRLQTAPEHDLEALRAAEDARLSTYGWVDRAAGVVHIPVDRAMALVLEEAGR